MQIIAFIISRSVVCYKKGIEELKMEEIKSVLSVFSEEVQRVLGNNLKKNIVYGSYARGDYNENSDIDIMILTSLQEDVIGTVEDRLYDVTFDFLMEYGVNISVIVKNEEHFKYWLGALPFYDNVERKGVVING